jgi:hypothetical protein
MIGLPYLRKDRQLSRHRCPGSILLPSPGSRSFSRCVVREELGQDDLTWHVAVALQDPGSQPFQREGRRSSHNRYKLPPATAAM